MQQAASSNAPTRQPAATPGPHRAALSSARVDVLLTPATPSLALTHKPVWHRISPGGVVASAGCASILCFRIQLELQLGQAPLELLKRLHSTREGDRCWARSACNAECSAGNQRKLGCFTPIVQNAGVLAQA